MPGPYTDHPPIQKNPEVLNRQRVDASRPAIDMAKTGLTRAFTSVKAVKKATPVSGRINTVFAIGRRSTYIDA